MSVDTNTKMYRERLSMTICETKIEVGYEYFSYIDTYLLKNEVCTVNFDKRMNKRKVIRSVRDRIMYQKKLGMHWTDMFLYEIDR